MALFHLRNGFISRGKGQSVVAAAAYRARERLRDAVSGEVKDYRRKAVEQPVLFSGIYVPKNAPAWAQDRGALWNAAEQAEDRHNRKSRRVAITAQDMELALMHELTLEENRRALQDFIREQFTRRGYAVDANIHGPEREGDQRNIHAHLLVSMRTLDAQGFSATKRQLDRGELRQCVEQWREAWAKTASRHLERAGHHQAAERMAYAHLTLEAQRQAALARGDRSHADSLAREATQHLGAAATRMERQGKASDRGDQNRATVTRNCSHWQTLGALHRERAQIDQALAGEPAQGQPAEAPGLLKGWWQAMSARAAHHSTPTPTQAHAQTARPRPPPPQAKAPEPARPLEDAEKSPDQEPEDGSRLARVMREREERQRHDRQEARERGQSIADAWVDGMFKKRDGPS